MIPLFTAYKHCRFSYTQSIHAEKYNLRCKLQTFPPSAVPYDNVNSESYLHNLKLENIFHSCESDLTAQSFVLANILLPNECLKEHKT